MNRTGFHPPGHRAAIAPRPGRRRALSGLLSGCAGAACVSAISRSALAQAADGYPGRTLRIIVAFAPGSGNDLIARLLAPKFAAALGQAVVVENRPGAGGMIGTEAIARAAPDGYTLGLGTSSQLVMNPSLYRKMPFDVDRDLMGIGLISRTPMVLAARKGLADVDLRAWIATARAQPRGFSYGSAGNGSISHVLGASFARQAGIELVHVPYKGNGPALQDLVAGRIDLLFDGFNGAGPLMRQGALRILATHGERQPRYPDVPGFAEAGLPNFEAYTWNCLIAPRGVPSPIVDRLNRILNHALREDDIRARVEQQGADNLAGSTPAEADIFGAAQRARWLPLVHALGIAVD